MFGESSKKKRHEDPANFRQGHQYAKRKQPDTCESVTNTIHSSGTGIQQAQ